MEASTTGSLPACSMPATETDIRRMVCSCADQPADAFGAAGIRGLAGRANQFGQHVALEVSRKRSGPERS